VKGVFIKYSRFQRTFSYRQYLWPLSNESAPVEETMIDYFVPPLVDGTPAIAEAQLLVSSTVRSYDGGTQCGDLAVTLPLSSGRTAIIVLDIAGHGAGRASLSSAIADEILTALVDDASPASAIDRADHLLRTVDDDTPYAVAFVALIHPILRTVVYASAGHDVAFTLADDGRIRHLMQTASMLGIPLANHACDAVFTLDATETLVIVTDGISDSHRAGSDDFFGATRTALAVTRSRIDGTDPSQAILEAACAHEGGVQVDDDAALVVCLPSPNQRRNASVATVHTLDDHRHSVRSMAPEVHRPRQARARI
jgi:serine phosphatase RsbU (regulator of sigma subunit)